PVAVEDERAGGVGAAEDLRAVAGDADGDRADAGAGVAHGPREALVWTFVLVPRRSAKHDQRRGDVVVGNDDGPRGAAVERVTGAIIVRVGGRDADDERPQAHVVEVEASGGVGEVAAAVDDAAVMGNRDAQTGNPGAQVRDVPVERVRLGVGFRGGRTAQGDRRRGRVVVADDDAARVGAGQAVAGA